jgi:dTMP kinase
MKTIAFEGLDKSGKAIQSEILHERILRTTKLKVVKSEFHRYDTPTGELIQKWLRKEYDVDQYTIELIMAADKQAQQKWIYDLESKGTDILILDRYTTSQLVYAHASGVDPIWELNLQSKLRKPNIEIFLDIPPNESMIRKGKHGDNDRYESDIALLQKVRKNYFNYYDSIDTTKQHVYIFDAKLDIEDIHFQIWERLSYLFE